MNKIRRGFQILTKYGPRELAHRTYSFVLNECESYLRARLVPNTGKNAHRSKWRDIRMLCSIEKPTIIDGGAHKGQSIDDITSVFDNVNIHAIEANPDRASELENKYDSENIEIYNVALGPENDEVEFNITKNDQSSSVLSPTDKNIDPFEEKVAVEKQMMVEQNRLDDIIGFTPDIIKLDLQGYELRALGGARDLLQGVELVLVETSFRELYEGQATFCELHTFLQRNGFEIFNIYDTYTTETGELAEFDALYRSAD